MNIFRKADPSPILIPLTWRQRLVAHAFDDMLILSFSTALNSIITFPARASTGSAWQFLLTWLFCRAFFHLLWHGLPWPGSHATPGLWMLRAKVRMLDGSAPSARQLPLLWRRGLPMLARLAFFMIANHLFTQAFPHLSHRASYGLYPFWALMELLLLASMLLGPWKSGFSNAAPTRQDLRCQTRPFAVGPRTKKGALARFFVCAFCFPLFVFTLAFMLSGFYLPEPFSGSNCGLATMAMNPSLRC